MNLNEIYTEIITEHSTSTRNRRHLEQAGKNPSCGDEIELELLIEHGQITDASFTGIGCAISQASASMMIDLIKGKSLSEAKSLAELFTAMIQRKITDDQDLEPLEEAAALKSISNLPARVKCAVMPWHTLETAVGRSDTTSQL